MDKGKWVFVNFGDFCFVCGVGDVFGSQVGNDVVFIGIFVVVI